MEAQAGQVRTRGEGLSYETPSASSGAGRWIWRCVWFECTPIHSGGRAIVTDEPLIGAFEVSVS